LCSCKIPAFLLNWSDPSIRVDLAALFQTLATIIEYLKILDELAYEKNSRR
jgi:hypothetical protein